MARRFDYLADVEVFITVAEQGSLSRAAALLSTTPSMVSRTLSRLEARVGAALLRRTTRSIGLTDSGHLYLEQCRHALEQIGEAERIIQGRVATIAGRIRISVPTTWGHYRLPPLIASFATHYPDVSFDINFTNRNVDLIAEEYDFAVRQGRIGDSGLIARRLEEAKLCLVASPAYLQRYGTPATIDDLKNHHCISFLIPRTGRALPWQFVQNDETIDWTPQSHIDVTEDVLGMVTLAESGLGICQIYDFIVETRLKSGALVEVLPALRGRSRPFSLLYARQKKMTAASRMFIEHLTKPNVTD